MIETQRSKPDNVVIGSPLDGAGRPKARTSKFPGAYLASVSSLNSGVSSDNTGSRTPDILSSPTHLPLFIDGASPTLNLVAPSPTSGAGSALQPELSQGPDGLPDSSSHFNPQVPIESGRGLQLAGLQTHASSSGPRSAVSPQVPGAYGASVYSLNAASSAENVAESPSSQQTATEGGWKNREGESYFTQHAEAPAHSAIDDAEGPDMHTFNDTDSIKSTDTIGSPARPRTTAPEPQAEVTQEPEAPQAVLAPEAEDLDSQTRPAPSEEVWVVFSLKNKVDVKF